ncbi:MAG: 50S ribosomal protein L3 [Chlamydiales bacterium]|nr:50S ribosomal protein L3 [Chlamydiales bacterium]MCH9635768.1 50S ribosomal protein L3 [Chlamydiales bacterium]MCH9704320.1 50S ribosomal protein L3 [Chlamydiota bacterium]
MTKKLKLMGTKRGMTQRFDDKGNVITCTVIHAEPNIVCQIKRKESDGYNALQLGYEKLVTKDPRTIQKRVSNQLLGHFKKASVEPRRFLSEARIENVDEFEVGQELSLNLFSEVGFIDVVGASKGKGFQGVIKRHNFRGGPAKHGSHFHRHAGSTGMRSTPGRCLPGTKKAGRMGNERVTIQNLRVVAVDEERNLLIVAGAIPGARGSLVHIAPALKKEKVKK